MKLFLLKTSKTICQLGEKKIFNKYFNIFFNKVACS